MSADTAAPLSYATPTPVPPPSAFDTASGIARRFVLEAVLVALCVYLAFANERFLTAGNLLNVLKNVSVPGVIALGMTMVIIAGEIDLSVGSAVAFGGCVIAKLTVVLTAAGWPMGAALPVAILAGLVVGTLVGATTGALRVYFRVPTFITTLAWFTILRGAAQLLTDGNNLFVRFPDWYRYIGNGRLLGDVPFQALVLIAAFALVQLLMTSTTFGRAVYAVGGNAEAARLSGINVGRTKVLVMASVALLAAVAAVMQSAQTSTGNPTAAVGLELEVISAVIIGGTSLMGGAGKVWGTMLGVVFLGVLINGMTLEGVNPFWQNIVRGGLILLAVLINVGPARRG